MVCMRDANLPILYTHAIIQRKNLSLANLDMQYSEERCK